MNHRTLARRYLGIKSTTRRLWLIESDEREDTGGPYRSGCFETKAEARFRLRAMADPQGEYGDWYCGADPITRQTDDLFTTSFGVTFRVTSSHGG